MSSEPSLLQTNEDVPPCPDRRLGFGDVAKIFQGQIGGLKIVPGAALATASLATTLAPN